jgi:hypothetical protein
MTNSLTLAAQNASAYSDPVKKDCKFCGREGLLILPVRCCTLPIEAGAPALPGHIGSHAKEVPISLSSYTLRVFRVGYLYMLINRKGALSWQCYISNAAGYWYQFAADAPPLVPPEFTCQRDTHGINASMVSIDPADNVKTAYLMFTPSPLTVAMMSDKELKNIAKAEAMCAKGQMVKFNPASWVSGNHKQPDCLDGSEVATSVAEFSIYKRAHPIENSLTEAMESATFPLMADGHETQSKAVAMAAAIPDLVRVGPLADFMIRTKAVAIALYDHIGVVQELNNFRNEALNKVEQFMVAKDNDGVSNRWKFDSIQAIRGIKAGFANGLVSDVTENTDTAPYIRARYEPAFPGDDEVLKDCKMRRFQPTYRAGRDAWRKEFPEVAAELDLKLQKQASSRAELIGLSKLHAQENWEKKYAPLLDAKAIAKFDTAFNAATLAATGLAAKRVEDHLAWVLHEHFISAFDCYDRTNLLSGGHFEVQSALATFGMTGIEQSAVQIDIWQAMPVTERKNIYMRGLLLNQLDIEKEAATALANAAKLVGEASSLGGLTSDAGLKMASVLKGLVKFFSAADKAWDEYVRESEKPGNARNKGLEKQWEGVKLFKLAELNRAVFRGGITNFERKLVGYFGGLVMARMGGLAEELRFDQLMYGIDPEKPHIDPKTKNPYPLGEAPVRDPSKSTTAIASEELEKARLKTNAEATKARKMMITIAQYRDLQRKAGITFTAEEYLNRKSHMTSNYHQARIGGLLAVMETFALAGKLSKIYKQGGEIGIEHLEAFASLLAVSSITCDIAYALAKSARESTADTAVKAAADITRGGWKLGAGALGAAAGVCMVISDYSKLKTESEGKGRMPQLVILGFRMVVDVANTGAGGAAAFSYSGPLFRRIEGKIAARAVIRRGTLLAAAEGAEWLAGRVFLLRAVAWISGAGLVLTVGEIGYEIYLHYQPNALEVWMKRSAFRNRALDGRPFSGLDQEIIDLNEATQLVGA